MLDSRGTVNPFRLSGSTVNTGISRQEGISTAVYYSGSQDITKGNSHYNVGGEVRISGVDVRTGSISGKTGKELIVESLQDTVDSSSRGYSLNVSVGLKPRTDSKGRASGGYMPSLSSIGAGYSRSEVEQKMARNTAEFTAGTGRLEVVGKVRQVGSLIDGNFILNAGGYEKEDLHDVDRGRSYGVNVTVYPNTVYTLRDDKGKRVYVEGINPKRTGVAVGTGISYSDKDRTREIQSTIGEGVSVNFDVQGVNRDIGRHIGEWEGPETAPINVSLGTEYWLTAAGRGKTRDIVEDAGNTARGIARILRTRDEAGNLQFLKNVEAENLVQKFIRIGFVETKGKSQSQVRKELEERFGSFAKKPVKVNFYDGGDVDSSVLDPDTVSKLSADGFAITGDGTVWINKDHVDSGKLLEFNRATQHEISHIVFGEDSEYQARYLEEAYGSFLQEIAENGYLKNGTGIIDYKLSMLTDEDWSRLNGYTEEEMQFIELTGDDEIDAKRLPLDARLPNGKYARTVSQVQKYMNLKNSKTEIRKRVADMIRRDNKNSRNPMSKSEENKKIELVADMVYKKGVQEIEEEESEMRKNGMLKKENRLVSLLPYEKAYLYFSRGRNQRENIIDSLIRQEKVLEEKEGRRPSDEYLVNRLEKFINKPHLPGSEIYLKIPAEVMIKLKQTEIYDSAVKSESTIWSVPPAQSVYSVKYQDSVTGKIKSHEFIILNRRTTLTGLQAMAVESKITGERLILAQGSSPGAMEPHKDPIGWVQDWLLNNLKGNLDVGVVDMALNSIRYAEEKFTGKKQAYREAFTPIQYRELTRYALDMKDIYGEIALIEGHSLKGAGAIYAGDRAGIPSSAADPAPNNAKIRNRYSHLVMLPDNPMLNRTRIVNDRPVHYTSFRHFGKIIPTPSIQIGDERYGFGVGATGVPVYRSNSHYKGDPTMGYDENLQRMMKEDIEKKYTKEDLEKKRNEDNHKLSEHFWEVREEIEDINTILVRPEGWDKR